MGRASLYPLIPPVAEELEEFQKVRRNTHIENVHLMSLRLPYFRDGEKLTKKHLYDLALFALDCSRWAATGDGASGLIVPPRGILAAGVSYNGIDVSKGKVCVRPLFLIQDGYPLIWPETTSLNGSGERVYAKLRLAKKSEDLEKDSPGYRVEFAWEAGNPHGQYVAVAELARRVGTADDPRFDLVPPASTPAAVPDLDSSCQALMNECAKFCHLLIRHAARSTVDRGLLLDRLERLASVPLSSPTAGLLAELRLAVRAARGFFLRLRLHDHPNPWSGQQNRFESMPWSVLEYELNDDVSGNPANVVLPPALGEVGPADTAAAQMLAVQTLAAGLHKGGELWRLLADTTLPELGKFFATTGNTGRVYDCRKLTGNLFVVRAVGPTGISGNLLFAFGDDSEIPPALQVLPQSPGGPDGRRQSRVAITGHYLFLSAPVDASITVTQEDA